MGHATKVSLGISIGILALGICGALVLENELQAAEDSPPEPAAALSSPLPEPVSPGDDAPLEIHVTGSDEAPVVGAIVEFWRVPDRFLFLRPEDERSFPRDFKVARAIGGGKYHVDHPPRGSYGIRVRASGLATVLTHWSSHDPEPVRVSLEPEHPISGIVLGEDGRPFKGADIRASWNLMVVGPDSEARSDPAGKFTLHGLDDGEVEICVSAEGYADAERERVPGGTADLRFTLAVAEPLEGTVVSEDDGLPVLGARVSVSCLIWRSAEDRTDAWGRFRIRRLPAKTISVLASHEDFITWHRDLSPVEPSMPRAPLQIRLRRGNPVVGRVLDADTGTPVTKALLVTWPPGEDGRNPCSLKSVIPDSQGRFEFKSLSSGTRTICARSKGYLEGRVTVNLGPQRRSQDLEVVLSRGGVIWGRVLDSSGYPVVDAQVTPAVESVDEGGKGRTMTEQSVFTDKDGRFRVEGVPFSRRVCLVVLHRILCPECLDDIRLGEDAPERTVEIRLFRGGTIQGRLIGADGVPVFPAWVSLEDAIPDFLLKDYDARSRLVPAACPDERGYFVLERVRPGRYGLEVVALNSRKNPGVVCFVREGETTELSVVQLEE